MSSLLCGETLKQSLTVQKIVAEEAQGLRKVYNHYLDKATDIMKNTELKVKDVFDNSL